MSNIGPGAIYTPRNKHVKVNKAIPVVRCGQPQDFGDLAVFLASDKGSYITISIDIIGGGAELRRVLVGIGMWLTAVHNINSLMGKRSGPHFNLASTLMDV